MFFNWKTNAGPSTTHPNRLCVVDIPLSECERLACYPLKWLRYVAFAIYGIQSHLSRSADGEPVNYDAKTGIEGTYYYLAFDERTSLPNGVEPTSKEREKATCIFVKDLSSNIDACHFIPHSKGDNYMETLFSQRGGSNNGGDSADKSDETDLPAGIPTRSGDGDLDGADGTDQSASAVGPEDTIDDVRNGLFLWSQIHTHMSAGLVGFMKTPNFALGNDDILRLKPASPNETGRLVLHHFVKNALIDPWGAPNNSDGREAQDERQRPAPFILDAWYGSCVVNRWCPEESKALLKELGMAVYYAEKAEPELPNAESAKRRSNRRRTDDETPEQEDPQDWTMDKCQTTPPRECATVQKVSGWLAKCDRVQ